MFKFLGAVLRGGYRFLKVTCVVVFGLIALGIAIAFISASTNEKDALFIADGSAVEFAIEGFVVEEAQPISPAALVGISGELQTETLLRDVTRALYKASEDERISAIVLRLDRMFGASPAALTDIGAALQAAKDAGKTIYAYGDFYTQPQYYLASFADDIWLNPAGVVSLTGYGIYPLYYKEALDKYGVTVNTFKAGTFKSFVEPYTRTNMSEEARTANASFLGSLWNSYKAGVNANLPETATLAAYVDTPAAGLRNAGGSSAKWALNSGLVTDLLTRSEMRARLAGVFGADGNDYEKTDYRAYLGSLLPSIVPGRDTVAILYAAGNIADGQQPAGTVGGDTLAKRIREVADKDAVKAIVLRIDSPGGSAFASEIIRQELVAAKQAGIKIVASFGGAAASGGYWIATPADRILAQPTTITGSIGVFAVAPSFEKTLTDFGVNSDGVATTPLAGAFSVTRGISDLGKDLIQMGVDNNYQRFISLVADSRGMTLEAVDAIAQGRVWTGAQGIENGLVDELGTLERAIEVAAELAGLETYNKVVVTDPPSPTEQLLRQIAPYVGAQATTATPNSFASTSPRAVLERASAMVETLTDDGVYARCLECLALSPIAGR